MKKGLILIILAGIMWGTSCVFVNLFAPYGFSSWQMTAIRMSIAFLGLFVFCLLGDRKALRVSLKSIPVFAICGITMFATAAFYYEAIQLTTASTAVVLMYISPVPIMLLSVWFLGERFNAKKGLAVVLMLAGCALVAGVIGDFKPNGVGLLMGLLSAVSYTGYNIFNKIAAKRGIDPFSTTLYTFFFAALCAILFSKPWELPSLIAQNPASLLPSFFLHSLATCLLPYLLYSVSLKYLSVGVASAMSIIEPMSAALIGFIVYQDPLSPSSVAGMVLIIGSVFLLGLGESKERKEKTHVPQKSRLIFHHSKHSNHYKLP